MNQVRENNILNFMLEPGDATCYRFGIQWLDDLSQTQAYTLASGLGDTPWAYVWVSIYMAGGSGVFVVSTGSLAYFAEKEDTSLLDYLQSYGHGAEAIDRYTLCAVLLAVNSLVHDLSMDKACKEMLRAREILMKG